MTPEAEGNVTDGTTAGDGEIGGDGTAAADRDAATGGSGSSLVDGWIALDRGWQALALGLGIVAVHAAAQVAGLL